METAPSDSTASPGPSLGLALTSLVLGILAVALSFLVIGLVLGLIGLVLGMTHLSRKRGPPSLARWGVGLSIAGVLASVAFGVLYVVAYQKFTKIIEGARSGSQQDFSQWQGVTAPDFSVTTLGGQVIKLSDLKGKRVVVDFWATWCPPCVGEIPHFIQLFNQTSRDDLAVVGISQEEPGVLKDFVRKHGVNYLIASASNLPPPYNKIEAIPTTFFIDRHGTIQTVLIGGHELADLKASALAADLPGTPKAAPAGPAPLSDGPQLLHPSVVWSKTVAGAQALCVGDWDNDGGARVLVAAGSTLHELDLTGAETAAVALPDRFALIECGRDKDKGAKLLGYSPAGQQVVALNRAGKKLWNYRATFGVDGAHWGDLDGDGNEEMIVGMNGFGGIKALSGDGTERWSANLGNVWNQAVVSATTNRPARVFATEAGGSVKEFDAAGRLLGSWRPDGGYYAQMTARAVDDKTIQIIAVSGDTTVVFDESGKIAWKTSALSNAGGWISCRFAAGDLKGDGAMEWVFLDGAADLVIATPGGLKVASIPNQKPVEGFAVAPRPGQSGLLVTLDHGLVQAYAFAP